MMKACIDKLPLEDNPLNDLFMSLDERPENILNEKYNAIIGNDDETEKLLIDAAKKSDFDIIKNAPEVSRAKMQKLTIWRGKMWKNGSVLRVKLIGGSPFLRKQVMDKAQVWTKFANIDFREVSTGHSDIRISFTHGIGSWSYVGIDAKKIPQDKPTMNFGWFNDFTSDFEISRTVLHEFGHALGCIHEHQSPDAGIPWDKPKVYKYYRETQGWSKEKVDQNLLHVTQTPLYPTPGSTRNQ